jgi:hypothetical protein
MNAVSAIIGASEGSLARGRRGITSAVIVIAP